MESKHTIIALSLPKHLWFRLNMVVSVLGLLLSACQPVPTQPLPIETTTSKTEIFQGATSTVAPANTPTPQATPTQNDLPLIQDTATAQPNKDSLYEEALFQTLDKDVDWFILIKDLENDKVLLAQNPDQSFNPASMIKVPLAMVVLAKSQEQGRSLENLQNIGIEGRSFHALLHAMIVHSEEHATEILEYYARGDDFLATTLTAWGFKETFFDPRRSSCEDLAKALEAIHKQSILDEEKSVYLLNLMLEQTENDSKYLGVLTHLLPGSTFANKRGTMGNPTIVADHGLLAYQGKTYLIIIAGTPNANDTANLETIGASIERFAEVLAGEIKGLINPQP